MPKVEPPNKPAPTIEVEDDKSDATPAKPTRKTEEDEIY